jgi:cephalosporin hydroxylase
MIRQFLMKFVNTLKNRQALKKIVRQTVYENVYSSPETRKQVTFAFVKLFADSFHTTWGTNTHWLGVPICKLPLDLWVYQEIIYELKPDLIIECGTFKGGSALFLASMCDLVNKGEVLTIDIEETEPRPIHSRITYLLGSSVSDEILEEVEKRAEGKQVIMVILDSDHSKEHVLAELRRYHHLVTKDSYLIVEDTIITDELMALNFVSGPLEAVEEFMNETGDFIVDRSKEKFYASFNVKGYLRRIA